MILYYILRKGASELPISSVNIILSLATPLLNERAQGGVSHFPADTGAPACIYRERHKAPSNASAKMTPGDPKLSLPDIKQTFKNVQRKLC